MVTQAGQDVIESNCVTVGHRASRLLRNTDQSTLMERISLLIFSLIAVCLNYQSDPGRAWLSLSCQSGGLEFGLLE